MIDNLENKKDYIETKKHPQTRILFLGTPKISADVLEYLITEGYNVIAAISQPDREKDRKGRILNTEVKNVCLKHNINVLQYDKIREHVDEIKALNPELILTISYGQIVPQSILDIPQLGCINLHGSILPKYRGAAPIQRVIYCGEKETGFTLMEMVKAMDAGQMYAFEKINIEENDNYTSLYDKMGQCAIKMVSNYLDKYINGELKGSEQNENEVTFANKIEKEDEMLKLTTNCKEFVNQVRALSYTPGAYLMLDNLKFKILRCHIYSNESGDLGKIYKAHKNELVFQINDGRICIDELQVPTKRIMKTNEYLNGVKDNLLDKKFTDGI